ncbi:MAG: sigma-70 family RNA polymerase sigma factor [Kiritimatiellae bacterium]|nr:sigma-70 family RNA polymerase sigma factor [Kiritimatiellia bacterium]
MDEAITHLVERARQGDREAFIQLMLACERELRVFLSAHAPSVDLIDEITQATYVACYENIAKYAFRGPFLAWLKGIARNLLLKELRQSRRLVAMAPDVLEGALVRAGMASLAEERPAEDEERAAALLRCMERLRDKARTLLRKRYAERRSVKELAGCYGKSESWVKVTLYRIRDTLRVCMSGVGSTV